MPNNIIGGNPFDYRRMGGILQGQAPTRPSLMPQNPWIDAINRVQPPPTNQPAQSQDPLLQALQRMQGGQATQAYRQHVGNIPQPEDYAPSRTRRLGSALTAAAASFGRDPQNAMALGSEIRDAPLRNAVTQWQMKGAGLKEQADLESQDVQGQIKYLQAIRESEKDRRDYQLKLTDQEIARQNADTTKTYREAQIANMVQQGWERTTDAQGNLIMFKPGTNERMNMGPTIEAPRLANEQTRLRNQGRGLDIQQQQANTYQNAVAGFVTPDAQQTAEAQAVRDVVLNNPNWAKWGDSDTGMVKDTSGWFSDTDVKDPDYQAFLAAIAAKKAQILRTQRPGLSGMGGASMIPRPPGVLDYNSLE